MDKKIVRVLFRFAEDQFCIDRPYDNELDDQVNCNNALTALVESMGKGTVVPALRVTDTSADNTSLDHIFMNLGVLPFITILDVLVYKVQEKKK
jgi:hypothetical protein